MLSVKSDLKSGDSAFHPVSSPVASPETDDESPVHAPELLLHSHGDESTFNWPSSNSYDEQRELLCTEEESSGLPSSSEEEENEENASSCKKKNVWSITKEQLSYYTSQFLSMQPNPRGVIHGVLAKEFFEKSRLPIMELRKIWQLSDVSKDGCLSLEEFLTAMHLVVLRRNDIELPEELPGDLQPLEIRQKLLIDHHNKDLYDGRMSMKTPSSSCASSNPQSKSPLCSPKPVNFDFHHRDTLKRDPNIRAPVALRLSPDDSPVIPSSDEEEEEDRNLKKMKHGMREVLYEQLWNQEDALSTAEESLSSLTLRNNNGNGSDEDELDGGGPLSLPPPSSSSSLNPLGLNKKEGSPPPPPPRIHPGKTHARSSSLDLNRFGASRILRLAAPPPPPPRYPLGRAAPDAPSDSIPRGASAVSRALRQAGEELLSHSSMNAKTYQQAIHNLKETNSVVARTINELHQEVSDTLEERIALEYQLEQLKAFGE